MNALQYTQELVKFPTVSKVSNAPICDYLQDVLKRLGFTTERIEYTDSAGVNKVNIVGKKGAGSGGMAYFAHTDVVPADPWFSSEHGPFEPRVNGDKLYGRGSCDMKGSIGSMLAATELAAAGLREPLYIALTADEEIGYRGAEQVARRSKFFREMVDGQSNGVVGEPTMLNVVHAHKGTYGFKATSHGKAAHSSTSEGINANLAMIPFLSEMKRIHDETLVYPAWQHEAFDPPGISWNIGINDHTKVMKHDGGRVDLHGVLPPGAGSRRGSFDRAVQGVRRCVRRRFRGAVGGKTPLRGSGIRLRPRGPSLVWKRKGSNRLLRNRRGGAHRDEKVVGIGPWGHRSGAHSR